MPLAGSREVDSFYTWETGVESHNKLSLLVDANNAAVKFDPPMVVKYTHTGTISNTGKNYKDSSFNLEYGGFGNLWGFQVFV